MRVFYRRLRLLRWTSTWAIIAIVSGAVGLLDLLPPTDPLSELIGRWQSVFEFVFLLGGLGIFFGIGLAQRWLQTLGVVLLGTSILVRLVALLGVFGFSGYSVMTAAIYAAVMWACVTETHALLNGSITTEVYPKRLLDE